MEEPLPVSPCQSAGGDVEKGLLARQLTYLEGKWRQEEGTPRARGPGGPCRNLEAVACGWLRQSWATNILSPGNYKNGDDSVKQHTLTEQ